MGTGTIDSQDGDTDRVQRQERDGTGHARGRAQLTAEKGNTSARARVMSTRSIVRHGTDLGSGFFFRQYSLGSVTDSFACDMPNYGIEINTDVGTASDPVTIRGTASVLSKRGALLQGGGTPPIVKLRRARLRSGSQCFRQELRDEPFGAVPFRRPRHHRRRWQPVAELRNRERLQRVFDPEQRHRGDRRQRRHHSRISAACLRSKQPLLHLRRAERLPGERGAGRGHGASDGYRLQRDRRLRGRAGGSVGRRHELRDPPGGELLRRHRAGDLCGVRRRHRWPV